jgi:hypothetical protein
MAKIYHEHRGAQTVGSGPDFANEVMDKKTRVIKINYLRLFTVPFLFPFACVIA